MLHAIDDMRDFLRRRIIALAADGVAYLRKLHRRARDVFMRSMGDPERFRRRREFRVCRPVLLGLRAYHFGTPISHISIVEPQPPPAFGRLAERVWILCVFPSLTVERGNP
jgi:hypothetical protein